MWAWLRSPRGSTMTATAVAALLALFWFAPWNRPLPSLPGVSQGTDAPAPVPLTSTTPAAAPPATAEAPLPATGAGGTPQLPAVASLDPQHPADGTPSHPPADAGAGSLPAFDVVRVEPTGSTVVAGRGVPGTIVSLMDGDKVVAETKVDASGQFALLPPDLSSGSHYLTLRGGVAGQTAIVSTQGVAVAVPQAGGAGKAVVAMLSPDQAPRVLSDGGSAMPASGRAPAASMPMAIQAVEASRGGKFTASGVAKAGSQSRLYLNGAFLADVIADKDGRWAVRVEKGMRPGQYVVRADELEGGSGRVVRRAEVPFTYPATLDKGGGKRLLMARAAPGAVVASAGGIPVVPVKVDDVPASGTSMPPAGTPQQADAGPVAASIVSDLKTATVSRGDSLWRISRKLLGQGVKYTEIYASNASQIRDPKLIYPGQVFVMPQGAVVR